MRKLKELLARLRRRYRRMHSDTLMSIIGICVLVVILIGGIILYNATQDQPLFSFFGRDIFGEDQFDAPDDDEDGQKDDKDAQSDKEEQKKEEDISENSGNGDIHFKEEENKTDNSKENANGGLTPSEDDKNSGDDDNEDNWSMFF